MPEIESFREYCVVEIMGHKKFAGLVTEQAVGGASFVRVDVPEVETSAGQKLPAFTKLFGAASIYCLSPCTEETARAFAATIRSESFSKYEAPRLKAPEMEQVGGTVPAFGLRDDQDDEGYDESEDDGGPW